MKALYTTVLAIALQLTSAHLLIAGEKDKKTDTHAQTSPQATSPKNSTEQPTPEHIFQIGHMVEDGKHSVIAEFNDPAKPEVKIARTAKLDSAPDLKYGVIWTTTEGTDGFLVRISPDTINKKTNEDPKTCYTRIQVGAALYKYPNGDEIRPVVGTDMIVNEQKVTQQVGFSYSPGGMFVDEHAIIVEAKK